MLVLFALLGVTGWCCTGGIAMPGCMFDSLMDKNGQSLPIAQEVLPTGPDALAAATAASTSTLPVWATIRIMVSTRDMTDPSKICTHAGQSRPDFLGAYKKCSAAAVLTAKKHENLLKRVVPGAVKMHTDRLEVRPVRGRIVVPLFSGLCANFHIPRDHRTRGVGGADTILYGAAGPVGGWSAWALACAALGDGRPFAGVFNVGPESLDIVDTSTRTVAHEIAHALGFSISIASNLGMVKDVNVRGKGFVKMVTTRNVVRVARQLYNCSELVGMELEDEGGAGTKHSHWERRNAMDEMMAGARMVTGGYYSALTMAFFEDTGLYRAKWGAEEHTRWGRNAGCGFLSEKCVKNGTTHFPDMFCTEPARRHEFKCTHDRMALGVCTIQRHNKRLPSHASYFDSPDIGGASYFMDYCPIIHTSEAFTCLYGTRLQRWGSRVGRHSRCVEGDGLRLQGGGLTTGNICVETACGAGVLHVRFVGDDEWYACPEGSYLSPRKHFSGGRILCPSKGDVCPPDGTVGAAAGHGPQLTSASSNSTANEPLGGEAGQSRNASRTGEQSGTARPDPPAANTTANHTGRGRNAQPPPTAPNRSSMKSTAAPEGQHNASSRMGRANGTRPTAPAKHKPCSTCSQKRGDHKVAAGARVRHSRTAGGQRAK
ncbi:putative Leishmanolysin [Trypanosoma vivax]|nr:putative Leishmanolysin [Trypanosoma vivax]